LVDAKAEPAVLLPLLRELLRDPAARYSAAGALAALGPAASPAFAEVAALARSTEQEWQINGILEDLKKLDPERARGLGIF
jgi:hypothetical protein